MSDVHDRPGRATQAPTVLGRRGTALTASLLGLTLGVASLGGVGCNTPPPAVPVYGQPPQNEQTAPPADDADIVEPDDADVTEPEPAPREAIPAYGMPPDEPGSPRR